MISSSSENSKQQNEQQLQALQQLSQSIEELQAMTEKSDIDITSQSVKHAQRPAVIERPRRSSNTLSSTTTSNNNRMTKPIRIRKRGGGLQEVSFDKILWRLRTLSDGLDIDYTRVAQEGIASLTDKIESSEIDKLTANFAHQRHCEHPDYDILASRIIVSNHHKETVDLFSQVVWELHESGQINDKFYGVVQDNAEEFDGAIEYERDYYLTYFGFKTFERNYGMRINGRVIERPQHMFMRVAVSIWMEDVERAIETYEFLSSKYFTHASPTNFNAGGVMQQLSSCFLVAMKDDSIKGIFDTLGQCADISKTGGGLGMHCSNIRSTGELIKSCGRGGVGLIPMLKGFEWMTQYVDQGRRRPGAAAIYLEPWHPDIFDFLDLKKNTGPEERRARDLHLAMWIPDLFMKRVREDGVWSLMPVLDCPGLQDAYGDKFEELYLKYEKEGKYIKQVKAQEVYSAMIISQLETGEPYMLFKDHVNRKNNQSNLGTIKSSNLCVSGDTRILTKEGYVAIKDKVDKDVTVWNGFEWSNTKVKKTGKDQKLLKIVLSDGTELKCTPYHKFYINQKYYGKSHKEAFLNENITKCTQAKDLKKGDKLMKHSWPVMKNLDDEQTTFVSPYTHGFFCGDGMYSTSKDKKRCINTPNNGTNYCGRHYYYNNEDDVSVDDGEIRCKAYINDRKLIRLYDEKKLLMPYLDYDNEVYNNGPSLVLTLNPHIQDKFSVPLNNSINTKLRWLEGYCDADGCVSKNGSNLSLQMASIHKPFLNDIRLMLSTMGVHSKVTFNKEATKRRMPDGKGGYKMYDCKELHRLLINCSNTKKLIQLGFNPKRLKLSKFSSPNRDASQFVKVLKMEELDGVHDTYCFTEKKMGLGTFEGIVTGQCAEITLYSDKDSTSVCNLASIALPSYIRYDDKDVPYFDFQTLYDVVRIATRNLNRLIDRNYYPTPETKNSNMSHRPIGIGIQGLADTYIRMRYPYDSEKAAGLNREIFETMYYAALSESCDIAKDEGAYSSYEGSPISQGKFQFEMWRECGHDVELSGRWDWEKLRRDIKSHGIRNSMLLAVMPTASTSQFLGFNEGFEAYTSNIYSRKTSSGDFQVINKQMVYDLIDLGLWNDRMRQKIMYYDGSIQNIKEIPQHIRDLYKTSWDLKQSVIIDQSSDRAPFICHTQSLNIHIAAPTISTMSSLHMYAWSKGLKTGMYYLRRKPAKRAIQATIDIDIEQQLETQDSNDEKARKKRELKVSTNEPVMSASPPTSDMEKAGWVCTREEGCFSCGA
jgi:ribonucleoside-diphosphate reductase alpha chain